MLDNLTGELRVFVKVIDKKTTIYNTQIGSTKVEKDGETSYINAYVPVNFSRDVEKELPDKKDGEYFDIIMKKGWFKAYRTSDKATHPVLFVNVAKVIK